MTLPWTVTSSRSPGVRTYLSEMIGASTPGSFRMDDPPRPVALADAAPVAAAVWPCALAALVRRAEKIRNQGAFHAAILGSERQGVKSGLRNGASGHQLNECTGELDCTCA